MKESEKSLMFMMLALILAGINKHPTPILLWNIVAGLNVFLFVVQTYLEYKEKK